MRETTGEAAPGGSAFGSAIRRRMVEGGAASGAAATAGFTPGPAVVQGVGGVQSGVLPLPDLFLERLEYLVGEKKGTNPDGTSCFGFGLRPIFRNVGTVGTGSFRIVWEKAKAKGGPFEPACPSCTMVIQDAPPGVGMYPEPRLTHSCQGYRWFRVTLDPDPDKKVIELREDNNTIVEFH